MKARAARLLVLDAFTTAEAAATPRQVGRMASTHGRPCSCWLCRSHKDVPPRSERGQLPLP